MTVSIATRTTADRVRRATDAWWARAAIGVLLLASLARLTVSGALNYMGIPPNVLGLEPLFSLIIDHHPITVLGPRSYGVVAMLLYDPAVRLFGRSPVEINRWALGLSLLALASAFALVAIRLRVRRPRSLAAMGILWFGFLPIVYAVAERMFDLLLLASLAATFFFYAGPANRRPWSGVTAAVGSLTKFLPLIFLPFLLVRDRRSFAYALAAIAGLLLVGQIVYGTPLGFGYPYYVGMPTASSIEDFSTWHEGFSPRQLLFKIAAGFHLQNAYVAPPNPELLSVIGYALEAAAMAYLLYVVFRYRAAEGIERRSIEFALGVATIYMVSPTIGHEHLPSMILVYTILAWYWLRSPVAPPRPLVLLAVASLVLTGVYAPMQVVGAVLPMDALMRWLGNEGTPIFGSAIGEYDFLSFPGYGAIMAWLVVVLVERGTRRAPELASSPTVAAHASLT